MLCFSILQSLLPMLALAPAVLLFRREDRTQERVLLEWSALLTAALVVSTIPASYNFVLMAFPVCVLTAMLLKAKRYGWLAALVIAYLGIGFPLGAPQDISGLALLLYVPRLPLMLAVLLGSMGYCFSVLRTAQQIGIGLAMHGPWPCLPLSSSAYVPRFIWSRPRGRSMRTGLPLRDQGFLNASPQPTGTGVRYAAFTITGYRLVTEDQTGASYNPSGDVPYDNISFTSGLGHVWVERALSPRSQILDMREPSRGGRQGCA